ncbi:iron ABC transporter ATP-binding protein [Mobilicoccus caccae]|uniref:ABC transporter permease n=1 Tax=Mobilicoccus caccae TaxID=1859295 RepID=A0ABQ6IPA1_9MICO|nr:ATP-binding cassette domain-containing protein [Mobilicoccus caccae]GMA39747.1 ABC transporter permease [Mobilicoccus caccae]
MIRFTDVTKTYGDLTVLGPVSGEIPSGGVTSLVGANGAGKSTLLTIIGRLLRPTSGHIEVGGLDVATASRRDLARTLAILRQENHLTARLRVEELVTFGRFPHTGGRVTREDRQHVERALEFLDLGAFRNRFLDQLSGGQRQRAFVAMTIAQDTDHLLLDEPLNNLDMAHAASMMRLVRRAADELGKTVVMVVHDINVAAAYSDRIVALRDGHIVADGGCGQIMTSSVLADVFGLHIDVHEIGGQLVAMHHTGVPLSTVA